MKCQITAKHSDCRYVLHREKGHELSYRLNIPGRLCYGKINDMPHSWKMLDQR